MNSTDCYTILPLSVDYVLLRQECSTVSQYRNTYGSRTPQLPHEFEQSIDDVSAFKSVADIVAQLSTKPKRCRFMRTHPGMVSGLHIDKRRACSINVMLDDEFYSLIEFRDGFDGPLICELKHKQPEAALLNLQIPHNVVNCGKGFRLVLSMGFKESYANMLSLYMSGALLR